MGIEIGTSWRQDDGFYHAALEQSIERLSEFDVPIVEQIAFPQEASVERIRQLSGALLHERGRGMRRDAGDLNPSRGQFDDKENIVGRQAMPRGDV
jgi:hypothetical protein